MSANKTIAITNDEHGAHSLHRLVRDGHQVDCKCRRCRHVWMEIDSSKHANGTGSCYYCPRCMATKIDRTRYYKEVPNAGNNAPPKAVAVD